MAIYRLEKAADPAALAQETIIQNLDPKEAERLSKVRNIGIAVGCLILKKHEGGGGVFFRGHVID